MGGLTESKNQKEKSKDTMEKKKMDSCLRRNDREDCRPNEITLRYPTGQAN